MKHTLVSDLEKHAFVPGDVGIGSTDRCSKVFDSEDEAIQYAVGLLRKFDTWKPPEGVVQSDKEFLREFQESLDMFELFYAFPIVEQ